MAEEPEWSDVRRYGQGVVSNVLDTLSWWAGASKVESGQPSVPSSCKAVRERRLRGESLTMRNETVEERGPSMRQVKKAWFCETGESSHDLRVDTSADSGTMDCEAEMLTALLDLRNSEIAELRSALEGAEARNRLYRDRINLNDLKRNEIHIMLNEENETLRHQLEALREQLTQTEASYELERRNLEMQHNQVVCKIKELSLALERAEASVSSISHKYKEASRIWNEEKSHLQQCVAALKEESRKAAEREMEAWSLFEMAQQQILKANEDTCDADQNGYDSDSRKNCTSSILATKDSDNYAKNISLNGTAYEMQSPNEKVDELTHPKPGKSPERRSRWSSPVSFLFGSRRTPSRERKNIDGTDPKSEVEGSFQNLNQDYFGPDLSEISLGDESFPSVCSTPSSVSSDSSFFGEEENFDPFEGPCAREKCFGLPVSPVRYSKQASDTLPESEIEARVWTGDALENQEKGAQKDGPFISPSQRVGPKIRQKSDQNDIRSRRLVFSPDSLASPSSRDDFDEFVELEQPVSNVVGKANTELILSCSGAGRKGGNQGSEDFDSYEGESWTEAQRRLECIGALQKTVENLEAELNCVRSAKGEAERQHREKMEDIAALRKQLSMTASQKGDALSKLAVAEGVAKELRLLLDKEQRISSIVVEQLLALMDDHPEVFSIQKRLEMKRNWQSRMERERDGRMSRRVPVTTLGGKIPEAAFVEAREGVHKMNVERVRASFQHIRNTLVWYEKETSDLRELCVHFEAIISGNIK